MLLVRISIFSQTPVFKNFTIRDGLPSNETYNVFQDSKGFVWICTDAGVVKYDANKFKTFSSTEGMPDNTVFEVKEDKKGRIWYRTFSGNIGYIVNDSVYTIEANEAIIEFQKGGLICSFHVDEKMNMYVGRQSLEEMCFLKISPPYQLNNVDTIKGNRSGSSWLDIIVFPGNGYVYAEKRGLRLGINQEICFLDPYNKCILLDSCKFLNGASSLTRLDRSGDYFVLANDCLLKEFSLGKKKIKTTFLNNPIINVYIKKTGELFISYRDKGIQTYLSEWNNSQSTYLSTLSNSATMEDSNGGIWYSTLKNGIFYSNNKNYQASDISNNTYRSVFFMKPVSENKLLVASEVVGFFLYKINKGKLEYVSDMDEHVTKKMQARCIFPIGKDELFISYVEGNAIYNHTTHKFIKVKENKFSHISFSEMFSYKSDIIAYNYTSAVVFDTLNYSIKHSITTKDRFTSFAYNPSTGEAFFGAIHGLYKFYGQSELLEKDRINSFRVKDVEFLNNRLFIATKGYGLVVKDGTILDTIGVNEGLLGNVCEKIVIEGNKCWVSSNKGLSCITYSSYKKYEIVNYPLKDLGTPSLIQDYFIQDSVLYFASGNMVYTYPLEEKENHNLPFYIYKVEVNNRSLPIKKGIDLSYDQSNIQIHYGALYYNFSGKVRYRYKLLPNDAEWTYTNESSVLFPSLSSGSYSLVLQAQKNNGSWIQCKEEVSFIIHEPFWRKWWFIGVMILIGFVLVSYITYFLHSKKVERILLRSKIKTRLYNLEIKAMKAQMNPHFIFNSLNSIQQFILANENENAYRYLSKFSKLVRKLLESNENASLSIDSEVEILNKYLEIESLRFKDSFSYHINMDPSIDRNKKIPHMMIQPFVENAIWHGLLSKQGERILKLSFNLVSNNCIECIIDDNGIGINKSKERPKSELKDKSLALEFIKERLQLFSTTMGKNFTVKIEDKSDGNGNETGTKVTITLPFIDSNS
ncbi:MAG: histidine kinase [Bacteroidota bacterium]|nr:histidine kinase [Bacteroidota bacterium]